MLLGEKMSVLQDLLSEFTDLSDSTSVYNSIVDKNTRVVVYNGEQSIAAIEKIYGTEFAITLVVTLQAVLDGLIANGDTTTAAYLSIYFDRVTRGIGLNFADDTVQARLDTLVLYLTQDVVNKLKAMGAVYKSLWEIKTGEPEPTLEEVQAAVIVELNRRATLTWINYVKNGILSNNGNGKSVAELKALIQEYN